MPLAERRGIPHHLIDIADPTEDYTAAQYARDAAAAIRDIHARGRLPILVGGTGFYYRALTRGLFPGPGPRRGAARAARGDRRRAAASTFLHRMLRRVDPESALRIQPRDLKRLVRALEVYLPDRPAADRALRRHRVADCPTCDVLAIGAAAAGGADRRARGAPRRRAVRARAARRDPRRCSRAACPRRARPFGGLVYRQALEHLHGVRDEAATRALIAQENRRYARRQLIWFRKEPNLSWFDGPGESASARSTACDALIARRLQERDTDVARLGTEAARSRTSRTSS